MSNWDLGFGREPAESYEPRHSSPPGRPDATAVPASDAGWPSYVTWFGSPDFPRDDDGLDPPPDAPYPLTYERDEFDGGASWSATSVLASSRPPAAPPPPFPPPPTAAPPSPPPPWAAAPAPGDRFEGDLYAGGQHDSAPYLNEPWWNPDAQPRGRRWLIPAVVAVLAAVIGATLVLLTSSHPKAPVAAGPARRTTPTTAAAGPARRTTPPTPAASRPAASPKTAAAAPPLTLAAAEAALAAYTTGNNSANAERSDSELATVETSGSDAIDAGVYATEAAADRPPYPAFAPAAATYYIPQTEPAGGPRWFVARVENAFSANPKKVTSTEYLLFTQAAPGGTWLNAVEPYLLPGANAPQIAIGADGLAKAVSVSATSPAVAPGQLAGLTAASLNGAGNAVSVPGAGEPADRSAQKFWEGKVPNATVTDTDAAAMGADGQTFALLTTNGGALVFYTDAAELTITPPAGSVLRLTVPGFYSSADPLTRAGLTYLDQFAAYDPPLNAGTPTVIGEYSGLTGTN